MPDFSSKEDRPWKEYEYSIQFVRIEEGVTHIGDNSFAQLHAMSNAYYPSSSLKSIGKYAFEGSDNFNSGILPDSITSIGDKAFYADASIQTIHLPSELTSVGEAAFSKCGFKSITLPDKLTYVSKEMFAGCGKLNFVYFSHSITSVGEGAFKECPNLHDVYMYESVKTFGKGIFKNSTLYSFTCPELITVIPEDTFSGCKELRWVQFGDKLETIEANAFYGCSEMTEITIDDSVKSIAAGAFAGCSKLATVNAFVDPAKLTWGASANDFIADKGTTCIVPGRYYDAYVAKFGNLNLNIVSNIFGQGSCGENLTWIVDGDGTMIISGTGPMYDYEAQSQPWYGLNSKIKKVVVESGVTSIGDYAFAGVFGSLTKVTLSDTVKSIGSKAFYSTNNLEGIVLPEGLTTIKANAFEESAIKSVNIPSTVTTISREAFMNCNRLKAIDLHDKITTIEYKAFTGCNDLQSVTIPGSIETWEEYTFSQSGVESVTICEGITSIAPNTFYECINLSEVNLPSSLTSIEGGAFFIDYESHYGSLESITLPANLSYIGGWAFSGQLIRSIAIPSGVTLEYSALGGCPSLNSITFLSGITSIDDDLCYDSEMIKSVTIPSTVTYVGYRAFYEGLYMEDIYLYPAPANVALNFDPGYSNINSDTKIHVLQQYLDDYKTKYEYIADQFVGDLDPNGEGMIDIGTGAHLYGYNLSLAGDIGVNFWFKIDENYLDPDNYIKFTVNGQEQIVKVSEATDGPSGSGAKIFRCSVVAKQMSDTITAQFYTANGFPDGSTYSYTIMEYANYILTHSNYTDRDKNITKAMLNYGASAQKYFKYKTETLANSVLPASEREVAIKDYTDIPLEQNLQTYAEPAMVSLILNTTITLKLYFHPEDVEGLTIKYGNKVLEKTVNGDYVSVKIENIPANSISSRYGVTFFDENNQFLGQTMYCPTQYIRLVLSQPEGDAVYNDDLKRLVSALYDFNRSF